MKTKRRTAGMRTSHRWRFQRRDEELDDLVEFILDKAMKSKELFVSRGMLEGRAVDERRLREALAEMGIELHVI